MLRQPRDQENYVRRDLPPGAPPYHQPTAISDGTVYVEVADSPGVP